MATLRGRARRQLAHELATRFQHDPGPVAVLARQVGRPPRQVRRLLLEAGVRTRDTTCLGLAAADLAATLARRYQHGVSIAGLGRDTGLTRREITHLLRGCGIALRTQRPLPADQISWLARRYRHGATLRELAALSGASYGSVRTALLNHGVLLRAPTTRQNTHSLPDQQRPGSRLPRHPTDTTMTDHPRPPSRAAVPGPSRRTPRITDHAGRLLLMQALRIAPFTHPDGNTIDAVTTAIWVLDGDQAPLRQQVTVMQKALVPALRCHLLGQPPLLARLMAHPHHQHPARRIWVFATPSPDDHTHATTMLCTHGDPFHDLTHTPATTGDIRRGFR